MTKDEKERQLLSDPAFIKRVCENFNLYAELGRMADAETVTDMASIAGKIARVLRAQAKAEAEK